MLFPAHHHMSVLVHQDPSRNPTVGSGHCGRPSVHVAWAPGVYAAGLDETDGGAARKNEDLMCRCESGAGWTQAHPIKTRERTGVG